MEKISIQRFFEADLRAAKIIEAEKIEKSNKLVKLQVDLGEEKRQLVAGIAKEYDPEELVGRTIIVVANLEPAELMGVRSEGMLLAGSLEGKPILATFDKEIPPGTKVK